MLWAALIAVFAMSTPLLANDDDVTVPPGAPAVPIDVLQNDDPSDKARITAASRPGKGTVSIDATGRMLFYTPAADATGGDSFDYTVTDVAADGQSTTSTSRVTVTFEVGPTETQMQIVGEQLLLLVVLAILLEQGLSVIFNYRWFLVFFDGQGVKTPVAVLVAYLFIEAFDINSVNEILAAFVDVQTLAGREPMQWPGQVVTALIVAGGSSLVFRLFESFGLRTPFARQREIEQTLARARIRVHLSTGADIPAESAVLIKVDDKVVGSFMGDQRTAPSRLRLGFELEPGERKITLTGLERTQQADGSFATATWIETQTHMVAPGASFTAAFQH